MSSTDVFVGIGDLVSSTFVLLEAGGNFVNYTFLIGGFVGLFIWLKMQANYNKEAAANNTLK